MALILALSLLPTAALATGETQEPEQEAQIPVSEDGTEGGGEDATIPVETGDETDTSDGTETTVITTPTVTPTETTPVETLTPEPTNVTDGEAEVNGTQYATLAAAVSAAQSGDTIVMQKDTTLTDYINITKSLTLDLNGKTITSDNTKRLAFLVGTPGVTFTIDDTAEGGKIVSERADNSNVIEVSDGQLIVKGGELVNAWFVVFVRRNGVATIEGGTLRSTVASALSTNGSQKGEENYSGDAVMNVKGGNLISEQDVAIYVPAGTLNISGGTITGATAVYSKCGTTTITGGKIQGTGAKAVFQHSNNGCVATGDALVIEACAYPNGNPTVRISGGRFTSENASAVGYYEYNENKAEEISITGGTFSTDPSDYVPVGYVVSASAPYEVTESADGALVVKPEAPEDGSVSGTLDGLYQGSNTQVDVSDSADENAPDGAGTDNNDGNLMVDLKTPTGTDATSTTLTVTAEAAQSLAKNNAQSLTLQTDVGSVKLGSDALSKLETVTAPVEITVEKVQGSTDTWEVTVAADGDHLLSQGTLSREDITIRVPYTLKDGETADNIKVFCLETGEDMGAAYGTDAGVAGYLTWTTSHLSTFAKTVEKPDAETYYTTASNGVQYGSLANAIANVNEGGTITLQKEVTVTTAISVGKNVTIDLHGHTITGNDTRVFHVKSGTLTLTGTGTVTSKKAANGSLADNQSVIRVGNNTTSADAKAVLVVGSNVTIKAPDTYGISVFGNATEETVTIRGAVEATGPAAAVSGNGSYDGTTISLEGAKISATCGVAIYHPQGGTMTITKSTVNGGIEAKSGTIKIENSTISAVEGMDPSHPGSGNGPSTSGYAIAIVDNAGYGSGAKLTVESGTVNGDVVYLKDGSGVAGGNSDGTITINGGTFNGSVSAGESAAKDNIDIFGGSFPNASAEELEGMLGDNTVVVTFDANGGTCNEKTRVLDMNEAIGSLPIAARNGYTFAGWHNDNGALVTEETRINSNIILTAYWSPIVTPVEPDTPSYGGGSYDSEPSYSNTIDASDGGSVKVSPRTPSRGETVTITPTPDTGYEVDEVIVTDRNGDEVEVTANRNGTYTFEQPRGRVTIEVTFVRTGGTAGAAPFLDVAEDAWYAEAVAYVYDNGLMSGTSTTLFSPNATTTRGMIVTMLYRLEGEPRISSGSAFDDVDAGMYYADAVAWASQNDIVTGYDEATFGPNNAITREQMAAILYRYAQYKGYRTTAGADLSGYVDADSVSSYALASLQWANAAGLVTGTSSNTLTPDGSATRAQVATIFMRFMEDVAE